MDAGHYVNSPPAAARNSPERRENSSSGLSRVFWVAAVGFGLLCIVHAVVNISLRIQGFEFCNKPELNNSANVTVMSPADVSALLLENDLLAKENMDLNRHNEMLKDQLSQQKDHIVEITSAKDRLEMRLAECERKPNCCPLGWTPYKSSCYQLSTEIQSWTYAKTDCEAKEGRLVVVNDEMEKGLVRSLGADVAWIGLRAKQERGWKTWTWLDGSPLIDGTELYGFAHENCAYLDRFEPPWAAADCADQYQWICEKELK